jgi:hypothetical protein
MHLSEKRRSSSLGKAARLFICRDRSALRSAERASAAMGIYGARNSRFEACRTLFLQLNMVFPIDMPIADAAEHQLRFRCFGISSGNICGGRPLIPQGVGHYLEMNPDEQDANRRTCPQLKTVE